jgi:hypothetical protein
MLAKSPFFDSIPSGLTTSTIQRHQQLAIVRPGDRRQESNRARHRQRIRVKRVFKGDLQRGTRRATGLENASLDARPLMAAEGH